MMKNIVSLVFALIFSVGFVHAQSEKDDPGNRYIQSISGPAGNYLYLVRYDQMDKMNPEDVFEIERAVAGDQEMKKIGEITRVQEYRDLLNYYSEADLMEMKKNYGVSSDEELVSKFRDFKKPEDMFVYYGFVETKRALGLVFLDDNVKNGTLYHYKVTKKTSNPAGEAWGNALCKAGMGNYTLPQLRSVWSGASGRDSVISIDWELKMDQGLIDGLQMGKESEIEQANVALHILPFSPKAVRARVMVEEDNQWNEKGIIFPVYNETDDVLSFNYTEETIPEQVSRAYLLLEDEVYNKGIPSDTAIVFSVDSMSARLIYQLNVQDTLNGIHLDWDPLPSKPYYSAIEITKYNSDDVLDTVAILDPSISQYLDRQVEVGQHYRYQVKVLFVPQTGLGHSIPAQGVGTFSRFTKPLPPTNLKAETVDEFIKLDWESVDEPSIYAYYVYRGTSPKKMELAAGPVLEKTYVDTLTALNGRSVYYYAISAQNYRQDTSAYSNIISIKPDKSIDMSFPETVRVYYANGDMHLSWRDVRKGDNFIEGFILQRKKSKDVEYKTIHSGKIRNSTYVDENISAGATYVYRVASSSYDGEVSEFSSGTEFLVEKTKVATINEFYVRNISTGVKISIPPMTSDNRQSYNIYKRKASAKEYSKLTTIPADKFEYTDTNVQANEVYVYKMTLVEKDGREGPKGESKTIRVKAR